MYRLACVFARLRRRADSHIARVCSSRDSLKASEHPAQSGTFFSGNRLMATARAVPGYVLLFGLSVLGGCVSIPPGPSVAVMPAPGMPFDVFVADDRACRAYAAQSVGIETNEAGAANLIGSAAVGTALGALTGAAIGGHHAAATGAGVGLATGTVVGTGLASAAQASAQRRYDIAYEQCMYSKGNQLPTTSSSGQPGSVVVVPNSSRYYPPAAYPPPPP
jgi:hypothetical protein